VLVRMVIVVLGCGVLLGCEYNVDFPQPVAPSSTAAPAGSTITITNTNNNTNTNDRSDTTPTTPPSNGGGGSGGGATLPLPTYAESVTRDLAAANPTLLANSCQDATGESAWAFLDLLVRTLRASDQRFGYLCKDANCLTFGADVITYKATSADTGIWIVDVIQNHCPGPSDSPPAVRWGVLPFDLTRRWSATRKAGIFP
jgi:hypothetical protein